MAEMNQEFEVDIREYARVIWKKKWFILGLFIVSLVGSIYYTRTIDPVYESSATILVQQSNEMQNLFSGDLFSMGKDLTGTYGQLLRTDSLLKEVIKRLDLRNSAGASLEPAELRAIVNVSVISGTDLLRISVENTDPEQTAKIANTLVELFQTQNLEMNKLTLASSRKFIEKQLQEVKMELEKAENDLLSYKKDNNIIVPTEEAQKGLEKLLDVDNLYSLLSVEQDSIAVSINAIQTELATQSERVISSKIISDNPLIQDYKGQITTLQSQLIDLKVKYTATHPEVVSLEERISKLTEALREEVKQEISSQTETINPIYQSLYEDLIKLETNWIANQAKLESYQILIQKYEEDLQELPEKELNLLRLERSTKVTAEIYTMLMTKLEETKIAESMFTSTIFLADPATVPAEPVKPNKRLIVMVASLLALFVGLVVSFILEYMDNTVRSAEDIEKMLKIPVLASIPDMGKIKNVKTE